MPVLAILVPPWRRQQRGLRRQHGNFGQPGMNDATRALWQAEALMELRPCGADGDYRAMRR
ncbi:hypothetical protein CNECB9_80020 [Cupriavidus necator]|uniref:Uncharacterized protein n=1 Tax=Cupriavidus necator TaxID=106590 RepID=A0A1K0ISA3_CUPNE|nr:hypothetical protein CNECB9_80020 [Cupriavidus necator]